MCYWNWQNKAKVQCLQKYVVDFYNFIKSCNINIDKIDKDVNKENLF